MHFVTRLCFLFPPYSGSFLLVTMICCKTALKLRLIRGRGSSPDIKVAGTLKRRPFVFLYVALRFDYNSCECSQQAFSRQRNFPLWLKRCFVNTGFRLTCHDGLVALVSLYRRFPNTTITFSNFWTHTVKLSNILLKTKTKNRDLSPREDYTDRASPACRRS
jgi:hypothetical protein